MTVRRGLAALIPTAAAPAIRAEPALVVLPDTAAAGDRQGATRSAPGQIAGLRLAEADVRAIRANPRQPREIFDPDALAELAHSLTEVGFLQPLVVRPTGERGFEYELVAGERRWRAAQEAGLTRVPVLVRDTADQAMLRDALLENLHRVQLNPLEEAAAYDQLLRDFGGTQDELATKLGRSRPQITNTLRLLKLPAPVQRRVAAGVLSAGHARALLALPTAADMERTASRIVAEGLSVRGTEELVSMSRPTAARASRTRPRGAGLPELSAVADRLGDQLDTRVQVAMGRSRGRISIDFASIEDLHRIVGMLDRATSGH